MDPRSSQDDNVKGKLRQRTPSKKVSKNLSQTLKESPSRKNQHSSSLDIKMKKPKLPLYSSEKAIKIGEVREYTLNDILKPVESLDNGFIPNEPPSSNRTILISPMNAHKAETLVALSYSQNSEKEAALSVLDVSDFNTCSKERQNGGRRNLTKLNQSRFVNLELEGANGNASEVQPSTKQFSDVDSAEPILPILFGSFKTGSGRKIEISAASDKLIANYQALYEEDTNPGTKTSGEMPGMFPKRGAGRLQTLEEQGIDNHLKYPSMAGSSHSDVDNCDHQDVDISPDQRSNIQLDERLIRPGSFGSFKSSSGKDVNVSNTLALARFQVMFDQELDHPVESNPLKMKAVMDKPDLDHQDMDISPDQRSSVNSDERLIRPVTFGCFKSGSGKEVNISKNLASSLARFQAMFDQGPDPSVKSPLKKKVLIEKPELDPFEGDAELFQRLQTPTKCDEITGKRRVEGNVQCPDAEVSSRYEIDACENLIDKDFERNRSESPLLDMSYSAIPSPDSDCRKAFTSDGDNVSASLANHDRIVPSDVDNCGNGHRLDSADPATVEREDRSPSPILLPGFGNVGSVEGKTVTSKSVTIKPSKESYSDWEEFPELKSSQAALLEQSAPKGNIAPNDHGRSIRIDNPIDGETGRMRRNLETSKPSALPLVDASRVNSTPLSSRALLNPAVATKRKSLPTLLEFVAKKPRTAPQDPQALSPKDFIQIKKKFDLIIASRKKLVSPAAGTLSQKKRSFPQQKFCEVSQLLDDAMCINSENAVNFRFRVSAKEIHDCEKLAESFLLLPKLDGTAGVEEVTTAFLTSPQVDPELVPNGWVRNHYRWIVWKLASYDRRFPQRFRERCLSVDNILLQLKYRYDREIDRVERPAFKKILEGDAALTKFICCLASVRGDPSDKSLEFELTDGWYSIWTIIDASMARLYEEGRVRIGTKLMVHGAQIANCEQGCDPLNVPSSVKLSISTNSVRRVKWHAKMGFLRSNSPLPAMLSGVLPDGGGVGKLITVVVRKYPIVYICKNADGHKIHRNERSWAEFKERLDKRKLDYTEKVQEELVKEAESLYIKPSKRRYTGKDISGITDCEELFSIWSAAGEDVEYLLSQLSDEQMQEIRNYKNEISSKISCYVKKELQARLAEWESNSRVTKFLKVRLYDCFAEKQAMLTIWNPVEDVEGVILENKVYEFFNTKADGTNNGILQLSSTRTLQVMPCTTLKSLEPPKNLMRVVTPLSDVASPNFAPAFGELDTVGVVVWVKPPEQTGGVTLVCLSDLEGHYLSITLAVLSVFGCEDLMKYGTLVACSNLHWPPSSGQKKRLPSVSAYNTTSFDTNPKQNHLRQYMEEMKSSLANMDVGKSVASAKAYVNEVLQFSKSRDIPSSSVGSSACSGRSPAICTPARSTPVGTALPGKTPIGAYKPTPTSTKSTPAAQKLQMLCRFGDNAPPLPLMPLAVTAENVFQQYKSSCNTPKRDAKP